MNETQRQLEILRRAREDGVDASNIPPALYRRYARDTYTAAEKVRVAGDVVAAAVSSFFTNDDKKARAERVLRICESDPCGGMFRKQENGLVGCDACGCSNRKFMLKISSPKGKCPMGHWTNNA